MADPAPSFTPVSSTCALVREIRPASLTVMDVMLPRLARMSDEPEIRSAWICAAVSLMVKLLGGLPSANMSSICATLTPVTTKVPPETLEMTEPPPSSTPASSTCDTVRVIAPALLFVMVPSRLMSASSFEPAPSARSAAISAAVSLTSMVVGVTPRSARVSTCATVAPVTTMVPPVTLDRADPAPSFTRVNSICAAVRVMAPVSLLAMPLTRLRSPRIWEPAPNARSVEMWAAVSLTAMDVGAKDRSASVPTLAARAAVITRVPPLSLDRMEPAPSLTLAAVTWASVRLIAPALLLAMAKIAVRLAIRSDAPPEMMSARILAAVSLIVMVLGGTPSARAASIWATVRPVTRRVPPVILAIAEPPKSLTEAASTCALVRLITPASLTLREATAPRMARMSEPPEIRSAWICAAVSLRVKLSGTTPNASKLSICATVTSVTANEPPESFDSADPAPSSTPANNSWAAVRVMVPALLLVMPLIWSRLPRMCEPAPRARSAWICAAVSFSVIDAGATGRSSRVSMLATRALVTTKVPPETLDRMDPAPSLTWVAVTCASVRLMAPALLLVMETMMVRLAIRLDEPPAMMSARILAAVSLTVMLSGATSRARAASICATVRPVTRKVPPLSRSNTDPVPSLTPASSTWALVREIRPLSLTAIAVMSPRLARMSDEPEIRSAWMWAAVSLMLKLAGGTPIASSSSICATVAPVTTRLPPVSFEKTDPAPLLTKARSAWSASSVMTPLSLLVMVLSRSRSPSSLEALMERSAWICADVSLTAMDVGVTSSSASVVT